MVLVDAPVDLVVLTLGSDGGAGAEVLPNDLRPTALVAAGEADEEPSPGEVVQHRSLLGHADGVLRRHDIAECPHADAISVGGPEGVDYPGRRAHLVTLRPEVVLDARAAPEAEALGGLHDVQRAMDGLLVALHIAPYGPEALSFLPAGSWDYRVELEHGVDHQAPPAGDPCCILRNT